MSNCLLLHGCSYISAVRANANETSISSTSLSPGVSSGRRIFAVRLNSSEPRMIWGAIRNAQLVRVLMPDWTMRVFVPSTVATISSPSTSLIETQSASGFNRSTCSIPVEKRVISSLRRLGAEIVTVNETISGQHTLLLDVLTSLDIDIIDYVEVRRPEWRLGEKETAAIHDWVRAAELGGPDSAVVHCIHDDDLHTRSALVRNLWGFRPRAFLRRINSSGISETLGPLGHNVDGTVDSFLDRSVWPRVADVAYCHDSVKTCHGGPPAGKSLPFPKKVYDDDGFVGQSFDENHEKIDDKVIRALAIPCSARRKATLKNTDIH